MLWLIGDVKSGMGENEKGFMGLWVYRIYFVCWVINVW